jgi:hypothetical protein
MAMHDNSKELAWEGPECGGALQKIWKYLLGVRGICGAIDYIKK